jgi:hypothetical protein
MLLKAIFLTVLNAPDAAKPHRKLCVTAHVGDSVSLFNYLKHQLN